MNLEEKRKSLPSAPGVYLMKDSLGTIIYVGKSKNLKNRVNSYFQNSKSHTTKTVKLVKNLKDFDYILTDTEFEAFILECKLIKEIKPIYNRLMKSPSSYTYIQLSINENYPDITLKSEAVKDDGSLYLGPYTSRNVVERGILGLKEHLKISCTNNSRKGTSCLNYSLGLCIGMCLDTISKTEYKERFDRILQLLKGVDKSILDEMNSIMNKAACDFDFETAAKYRDYISSINYILTKKVSVDFMNKHKNIALVENLDDNFVKLFLIKGNKIIFSEKYKVNSFTPGELTSIFKNSLLTSFNNSTVKALAIDKENLDEAQIIYSYIKNKNNGCKYAIISERSLRAKDNSNIDKLVAKLISKL